MNPPAKQQSSTPWWLMALWVAFAATGVINLFANIPNLGYLQLAELAAIATAFVLRAGRS
jgi:hypothetical protein